MGKENFKKLIMQDRPFFVFFFLLFVLLIGHACEAEGFSDRVAAFVDEDSITASELQEQYMETLKMTPDITKEEVLNTMINRILILREANTGLKDRRPMK